MDVPALSDFARGVRDNSDISEYERTVAKNDQFARIDAEVPVIVPVNIIFSDGFNFEIDPGTDMETLGRSLAMIDSVAEAEADNPAVFDTVTVAV